MDESQKIKELEEKILILETHYKHVSNELIVTKKEYEKTTYNYFDIYSNMGKKVEEQTRLLQTVLDNIPAYVYWKSQDMIYLGCNRKYAEIFGLMKPDNIIGKTDFDLYKTREEAEFAIESDKAIITQNKPVFNSIQLNTFPDGRTIWFQCSKIPLQDAEGNVIGILGISEDISGVIQKEREQRKLKEHIQQTQKLQSLGVLAGGIAHDFNNILTPVIGYAEMGLKDLKNSEQLASYLQLIIKGGQRAKELVKQILTFSPKNHQKKELINLPVIVHESIKLMKSSLQQNINIIENFDHGIFCVMADANQMEQVIINLCTNAGQAMQPLGGGTLEISLKNQEITPADKNLGDIKSGTYVRLDVRDSGIGMEKDTLPLIFDPFFSTKKNSKGTGLGLSVVHGIIKNIEGFIFVESEPMKGACFTIFIPAAADSSSANARETSDSEMPLGNKEKILFVDDETMIVDMMREMLKSLNYVISTAPDAMTALEIFKGNPNHFDVVITDYSMPIVTGMKLAEEIKKIRPEIPIIMCTGYCDSVNAENDVQKYLNKLMTKPVSMNDLAAAISENLHK